MRRVEDELVSRDVIDQKLELIRLKEQLLRVSKSPLELINQQTTEFYLKELFEGFVVGMMKAKDQSMSVEELAHVADGLSRFAKDKSYEPFVDDQGVKFVLEKQLGVKVKMERICEVVDAVVRPWIAEVGLEAVGKEEHQP